jgi:opacity protein-like surface antigen
LNSVNFSFGTRLYKRISFGAAVNVYTGEGVENIYYTQTRDHYIAPNKPLQYVLWELNQTSIDTIKFSGVNFTIGFRHDGDKLDAGLMFRTPLSLKYNTGQSIYTIITYNGIVERQFSDTTFVDDLLIKHEMPLFVGGGIAYNVTDNLLVALDGEYRGFSGRKIKVRTDLIISPSGDNEETFEEVDPDWNDVFAARAGAEYMLRTNSSFFPVIPLRAGFGYVPIPWAETDTLGNTSTATSYSISGGCGIHWSQIHLDVSYSYRSLDYSYVLDLGGAEAQDIFLDVSQMVEAQSRQHQFDVMFTGYF